MSKRRTTGDKDAPTRFAYPGANIMGLNRGRDAPLSKRARVIYFAVVFMLVAFVVTAIFWARTGS